MENPFTPGFGWAPVVLAGRDETKELFAEALAATGPHPSNAILLSGQRGVGKTVMLDELGNAARAAGWHVIDITADDGSGWMDELAASVAAELRERDPEGRTISGVSVLRGLFSIDFADKPKSAWTPKLRELLTALAHTCTDIDSPYAGTGVMVTLDEVQTVNLEEIRKFGKIFQHLSSREGKPLKFACAGLPSIDRVLLQDKSKTTFLSRLDRNSLGRLADEESRYVIEESISTEEGSITPAALDIVVSAAKGSPYLLQLIGFHSWRAAKKRNEVPFEILSDDVRTGLDVSTRKFASEVTSLAWRDLTTVQRTFILAMALDNEPTKTSVIATRLGKGQNYVSPYRRDLIRADVIYAPKNGYVDFVEDGFREFVRAEPEYAEYQMLHESDA